MRRHSIGAWENFDLASNLTFTGLQASAELVKQAYDSVGQEYAVEMAHLIFLAGAEALLDVRVPECLGKLSVRAPVFTDGFMKGCFEYMVFDEDGTVHANYCELVLANRVATRWLRGFGSPWK